MGQRLVIEFEGDNEAELVATGYYHWDAYTMPALDTLGKIINTLGDNEVMAEASKFTTSVVDAVVAMTHNGAFIHEDECVVDGEEELTKYLMTLNHDGNRNDGIVSISPDGMQNSINWSEGYIGVDLNHNEFTFRVYCPLTPEEYNDIYADPEDEYAESRFEDSKVYTCPIEMPDQIPFDAFEYYYDLMESILDMPSHSIDENGNEVKTLVMYKGDIIEPIY